VNRLYVVEECLVLSRIFYDLVAPTLLRGDT